MNNKKIAIITARGGSKRIPKKNIKEFCGKPIILYSIEAALKSKIFDEVMVSTDSFEIAEISKKAGAKVPFMRSKETSDDFATTSSVILEVLKKYKELGKEFKYACCIYPTAPFVNEEKLINAMEMIQKNNVVEVMPVVKFSYPPQRSFSIQKDLLQMNWPEYMNTRSQELEIFYHDCGQFYCYDVNKYIELNGQISANIMPIIIPESEAQDIDNEEDWKIAEIKYTIMKNNRIR